MFPRPCRIQHPASAQFRFNGITNPRSNRKLPKSRR
jgi:hypothetical protein